MRVIPVLIFLSMTTSCAVLDEYQSKGAKELANLMDRYCLATDEYKREELRGQINEASKIGATAAITCP